MKTQTELNALREKAKGEFYNKDGYRVVVGLATCGISAGAKPVYELFKTEAEK